MAVFEYTPIVGFLVDRYASFLENSRVALVKPSTNQNQQGSLHGNFAPNYCLFHLTIQPSDIPLMVCFFVPLLLRVYQPLDKSKQ